MTPETVQAIAETVERRGSRPADVQFAEMVVRGAIDGDGNVILRRPEPPGGAAMTLEEAEKQIDSLEAWIRTKPFSPERVDLFMKELAGWREAIKDQYRIRAEKSKPFGDGALKVSKELVDDCQYGFGEIPNKPPSEP